MAYPYQLEWPELVERLDEALTEAKERHGHIASFEVILLTAGLDISDSGDSQRCSRALQTLRKRGRLRYRRSYAAWEIFEV